MLLSLLIIVTLKHYMYILIIVTRATTWDFVAFGLGFATLVTQIV